MFTTQNLSLQIRICNDTTLWHRHGSILVQVMTCCLTAPSHYLKQHRLIINEACWLLAGGIITQMVIQVIHYLYKWFQNYIFENTALRGQWVKHQFLTRIYDLFSLSVVCINGAGLQPCIWDRCSWFPHWKATSFRQGEIKAIKTYAMLSWIQVIKIWERRE